MRSTKDETGIARPTTAEAESLDSVEAPVPAESVDEAPAEPQAETPATTANQEQPQAPERSRSARTLRFVLDRYSLVFSRDKKGYVIDNTFGNPQTLRVGSPGLYSAIRKLAYVKDRSLLLTTDDLDEIMSQLEALCELTGEQDEVSSRVAQIDNGIEIDVADDAQTRIVVRPGKVQVITKGSTTKFCRSSNFLPYPIPAEKGDLNRLLPYLNLMELDCWLLIAWICYTLAHAKVPTTKYVFLVLRGDRGGGKTVMCEIILSALVGPSTIGVQTFPGSPQDLAIAAQNAHVLFYDNMRKLSPVMSDTLCIASTSGSFSTRKLYSDDQLHASYLHCAMVLNGIHAFVDQDDLAQRCMALALQPIPPANRMSEKELSSRFEQDLPVIFRGILDLIAGILTHLPTIEPMYPERMLDFVLWLAAMEKALGLPEGELQRCYSDNLIGAVRDSLQDNPLAAALMDLSQQHKQQAWVGTPTELLLRLGQIAGPQVITTHAWPQSEISLSLRLKKLISPLRGAGVDVVVGRRGRTRQITVLYTGRSS
jgi:hypothetical protein